MNQGDASIIYVIVSYLNLILNNSCPLSCGTCIVPGTVQPPILDPLKTETFAQNPELNFSGPIIHEKVLKSALVAISVSHVICVTYSNHRQCPLSNEISSKIIR